MPSAAYKGRHGYDAPTLRACWLLMVNQGGWWTCKELRHELELRPALADDAIIPDRVSGSLSHAALYNFMTARAASDGGGLNEYAVMPDNCVPKGIAIKHIVR